MLALCALVLIGGLSSCSEDSTGPVERKPLVTGPGSVDFGSVSMGLCKDTTIRYDNTTGKPVTLTSITFAGEGFEWIGLALPVEIAAGASVDLKVRFCPSSQDTARATLVFKGTGGDSVAIKLSGFSNDRGLMVGDRFIYETHLKDETGARVPGSEGIEVDEVTAVGVSFEGKNNVIVVSEGGIPTQFVREANGDVSIFVSAGAGNPLNSLIGGWKRLPYGSKATVELLRKDTSLTVQGVPVQASIVQTAKYSGQSTMVVSGTTYSVENVTLESVVNVSSFGFPIGVVTNTTKAGYIAAIGYQGAVDSFTLSTIPNAPSEGSGKVLTEFQLK